ncbi:MAG: glutaminase [Saprospiraceae bacterium]|nr:glutaminase [Saprospiraceae bacterium]
MQTQEFADILQEIYNKVKGTDVKGSVADYIPELARVAPANTASVCAPLPVRNMALVTWRKLLSIQSISKIFATNAGLCSRRGSALDTSGYGTIRHSF